MGKTHKEQRVLKKEIASARSKVTVGAQYWHYKGKDKIYTIVDIAIMEANNELCVIYRADYGERLVFIRPVAVWLEMVEWRGKTVPRLTKYKLSYYVTR